MLKVNEKIVALAKTYIGYKEGFNNDNIFGKHFGINRQPWCAFFPMYLVEQVLKLI